MNKRQDDINAEAKRLSDAGKMGLFTTLRRVERNSPHAPRIGKNRRLSDEPVHIGQDPDLRFPTSDLSDAEQRADGKFHIRSRTLGYFGPQGALPLNTTEEVARWAHWGDHGFVKFVDIFSTRFLQLFFRAWSDSHAITQFDQPDKDRFQAYIGALSGISTPAFRNHDSIDDTFRTSMVGLHAARVKSPVRLRQLIEHHLGSDVEVQEHAPTWIEFEESDRNSLGARGSSLGRDMFLGARMRTVNDRIKLNIRTRTLPEYRRYLPGGTAHKQLADLVFWYLGKTLEVAVELSLPANEIPPATLGETVQLGWMAAVAPDYPAAEKRQIAVAKYILGQQAA